MVDRPVFLDRRITLPIFPFGYNNRLTAAEIREMMAASKGACKEYPAHIRFTWWCRVSRSMV